MQCTAVLKFIPHWCPAFCILDRTALYYTVLHCTVLQSSTLYRTALCPCILYYITLHCAALTLLYPQQRNALHCTGGAYAVHGASLVKWGTAYRVRNSRSCYYTLCIVYRTQSTVVYAVYGTQHSQKRTNQSLPAPSRLLLKGSKIDKSVY